MEVKVINEQSLLLYFKEEISEVNYQEVDLTTQHILSKNIPDIRDVIPSYRAIMINFNNDSIDYKQLIEKLELDKLNVSKDDTYSKKKMLYIFLYYIT